MGILLIIFNQILMQCEGIVVKYYGKKYGGGGTLFNAIICLFAMIVFVITDRDGFFFPKEIFIYGFINCLLYANGFYFMYLALRLGSYALTRLMLSFSGVFAIFYGIFFLKEPTSITTYVTMSL